MPTVNDRLAVAARMPPWLPLVALFGIALAVRAVAASLVTFAPNEGSAYYVDVARNVVGGRGLVTDAMWSYATPPLVLPKPAFELWLPMATFLAALPMTLFGPTLGAAQLSSVVVGAAAAPLTWLVARDAARHLALDPRRTLGVSLGSGLAAAFLGPFLVAAVGPDSTTPFLTFAVAASLVVPRALGPERPSWRAGVILGVLLGLAYLSRQEAIYLGVIVLAVAIGASRAAPAVRSRGAQLVRLCTPIAAGGLIIVVPWLARNAAAFGTLFPGQALENVYLTTNEGIFAYADRPTLSGFLDQGLGRIVGHQVEAVWHDLFEVLVVPAFPVGLVGLVGAVVLWRSAALRSVSPLRVLLLSGLVTFAVTSLLLPVATRWGTFLHASGPLLVALIVLAVLVVDRVVARVSAFRRWDRPNPWLAAILVVALVAPLGVLQAVIVGAQSRALAERYAVLAAAVEAQPEMASAPRATGSPPAPRAALVTDHPIWLAELLDRPVIALPDEPPDDVVDLAHDFGARLILVVDVRGRYPDAFDAEGASACVTERPLGIDDPAERARLFVVEPGCRP
jgi:hypothetical protein